MRLHQIERKEQSDKNIKYNELPQIEAEIQSPNFIFTHLRAVNFGTILRLTLKDNFSVSLLTQWLSFQKQQLESEDPLLVME